MKKRLLKYLGINSLDARLFAIENDKSFQLLKQQNEELNKEVLECMRFIGALYDYLEVRPKRTFVQDYSRLPEERYPTMEIIKAEKCVIKKAK